ncbi:hypothetical protein G7046_g2425 [Stylonectria norvegica]|nr:hypothetical protein G7046_g2425 [Stylonectria norvegica]
MLVACRDLRRGLRHVLPKLPISLNVCGRLLSTSKRSKSTADKLIYPDSPSKEHSDLSTFLAYVERTSLNKRTSVYRGTHYEYTVGEALSQYGFSLKRTGGASDRGMDLLGTWTIPSTKQTINVVLQCKCGVRTSSPMYVRELKGALKEAPPGWRGPNAMGLLVGEKPATKGVQEELRAEVPLAYVCCSRKGEVQQLLWNLKAQEMGLDGVSVGVRHVGGSDEKQLVLMRGEKLLPLLERRA